MTQDRSYQARVRYQQERTRALRTQRQALAALVLSRLARLGIYGLAWFVVGFAFCYLLVTAGVIAP